MKITFTGTSINITPTGDGSITINQDGSVTIDAPSKKVSTITYDADYLKKLGPITAHTAQGCVQTVASPGILMNGVVPTPPIPYLNAIKSSLDGVDNQVTPTPTHKGPIFHAGELEKVPGKMPPLSTVAFDGDVVSRLYENALTQAQKEEVQRHIQQKIDENREDVHSLAHTEDVLNRFIGDTKRGDEFERRQQEIWDDIVAYQEEVERVASISALDEEAMHTFDRKQKWLEGHPIATGHWNAEEVGYATKGKQEVAEKVTMGYVDRKMEHARIAKELLK